MKRRRRRRGRRRRGEGRKEENVGTKLNFFLSNQNGEAKRERVARMRRARSMPKMDDQEVIHNGNGMSNTA